MTDTADPNGKDPQILGRIKVLMVPRLLWESHCEEWPGAALQVGLRWALSTRDAPAIPYGGCALRGLVRSGLPTVGTLLRYYLVGLVCLVAGWPQHIGGAVALLGRSGDTMVLGGQMTCIWVKVGTARDALRYNAVGLVRAGLPKVGTFRPHQTVPLCLCSWQLAVGALRWRGLHLVWRSITCQTCSPSWDLRHVV